MDSLQCCHTEKWDNSLSWRSWPIWQQQSPFRCFRAPNISLSADVTCRTMALPRILILPGDCISPTNKCYRSAEDKPFCIWSFANAVRWFYPFSVVTGPCAFRLYVRQELYNTFWKACGQQRLRWNLWEVTPKCQRAWHADKMFDDRRVFLALSLAWVMFCWAHVRQISS